MRVQAYRNLNKPGVVYSLKNAKTGRVDGYAEVIIIAEPEFRVQQAGRERVLREKQKVVHAYIVGEPIASTPTRIAADMRALERQVGRKFERVRYNPYLFSTFVRASDESPVFDADYAVLKDDGAWAILHKPAMRANPPLRRAPHVDPFVEMEFWNG